jgi:hypothetical protein
VAMMCISPRSNHVIKKEGLSQSEVVSVSATNYY